MAQRGSVRTQFDNLVDPEGVGKPNAKSLAKRLDSLDGITLGVLDDNLPNADHFLHEVRSLLEERNDIEAVVYHEKPDVSLPAEEWQKAELTAECDAILVGVGDCGSCTSQCISDAVDLEGRGTPCATFVSSEFSGLGQYEAKSFGMGTLPIVEVEYPLAYNIDEDEARSRAPPLIDEVVHVLTTPSDELEEEYQGKYLTGDEAPISKDFVCEF